MLTVSGGGSGWTAAGIGALLGNNSSGLAGGSTFGIDTSGGSLSCNSNIAGSLGLAKLGGNSLILAGSNSYSGTTTISAGTLQIGSGGASGTLGPGPVVDNSLLLLSRSGTLALANAISGSGSVWQNGPGTLMLTAANTYGGGTTLSAGTLAVSSSANLGSGRLTFSGSGAAVLDIVASTAFTCGASITLSRNAAVRQDDSAGATLSGPISGPGNLTKSGSGWLGLRGANTYTGGTTISDGILQVLVPGALPDGPLIIAAGGTVSFNPSLPLLSPLTEDSLDTFLSGDSRMSGNSANSSFSVLPASAVFPAASQSAAEPVPEPDTLLLLLAAAAGLLWHVGLARIIRRRVGGARNSQLCGALREPVQNSERHHQGFDSVRNPPFPRRFAPRTLRVHEQSGLAKKDDDGRRADGRVLAGEGQPAGGLVAAKGGDGVAPLVAGKEKVPARVEAEAPRVIAVRPLLAPRREEARFGDREAGDAVVQAVGGVHEPPVGGDRDLGGETGPGKSRGKAGNRLFGRQPPARGVVVEDDDRGGLLLQRIQPAAARVEGEMPRPIAVRQFDEGEVVLHEPAPSNIELPDEDPVATEVAGENESSGRVALDHVARAGVRGR